MISRMPRINDSDLFIRDPDCEEAYEPAASFSEVQKAFDYMLIDIAMVLMVAGVFFVFGVCVGLWM